VTSEMRGQAMGRLFMIWNRETARAISGNSKSDHIASVSGCLWEQENREAL
jgi:hypothetical protein